eukprot:CAMPEP_0206612074 /NCGR_PEP_ID=MMETSP0325_2-20121206/55731_1 /ASSEMBLY_ACC=CAM_ASM_000347 /TAXON_ID=2866 /ORGANISM="Crypthecodinium cohnii, Strain Seligo" /LENGTH=67 /DNA_ID=CAMNT_0054131613 /DNA_START=126 /DNA_END=329 /DNA_ORIENTATION=-
MHDLLPVGPLDGRWQVSFPEAVPSRSAWSGGTAPRPSAERGVEPDRAIVAKAPRRAREVQISALLGF